MGFFGTKPATSLPLLLEPSPRGPLAREVAAVPLEQGEYEAYSATAARIGFEPAALLEARILAFMRECRMPRYDLEEVQEWMSERAAEQDARDQRRNIRWRWAPLRARDAARCPVDEIASFRDRRGWQHPPEGSGAAPYAKAVPLRVLAQIERLDAAFPQAGVFVTDYVAPAPDPFAALVARGMDPIVFAMWDEPGFGT